MPGLDKKERIGWSENTLNMINILLTIGVREKALVLNNKTT